MKADIFYLIFRIVCVFVQNWNTCSGTCTERSINNILTYVYTILLSPEIEVYEVGSSYSVKKVQ
jgi:hypothetical protein